MNRDGIWRKAFRSSFDGNCVEVAGWSHSIGIRDSKLGGQSPVLVFSPDAFREFIVAVNEGKFDRPCSPSVL